MSSGNLGGVDFSATLSDEREDLSGEIQIGQRPLEDNRDAIEPLQTSNEHHSLVNCLGNVGMQLVRLGEIGPGVHLIGFALATDEIFETATLIQTQKIQDFPLVLLGRDYWRPLLDFFRDRLIDPMKRWNCPVKISVITPAGRTTRRQSRT